MGLYEQLRDACDFLTDADFHHHTQKVWLRDDSDGAGEYIEKWEHEKPIPEGFTLGKPLQE